jgi:hypothetical protein
LERVLSLDGVWDFVHESSDLAERLIAEASGLKSRSRDGGLSHRPYSWTSVQKVLGQNPPWRAIQVPGPWQAQFDDLRLVSGVGWYRKEFTLPVDWPGGVTRLHFGAVDYFAEVWLNGVRLGEHEGGYLPFAFTVQDVLRRDVPNELIVRVVDPGPDTADQFPEFPFGETPHGKQNWYGPTGGIWQSVQLEHRGTWSVERLRLTPRPAEERLDVGVRIARGMERLPAPPLPHPLTPSPSEMARGNSAPLAISDGEGLGVRQGWGGESARGQLRVRVFSPTGQLVGEATAAVSPTQSELSLPVSVPAPELWDPDRPNLYRIEADVSAPDGSLDRVEDWCGFRTIETRDGQILLNGRPIFLRGALDQDYYPGTICTPPSDEFLADRFRKAKALGLNCLRCHIKIADPRYYALADRLGLLIWYDLPSWGARAGGGYGLRTAKVTERALQTLEGMIERDGNHPSIFCWTIVNEDWGTKLPTSAEDRAWLRDTYRRLKQLDPTRLVVDNSPCPPNFHVESDLDDFHFYRAIPDHAEQWSQVIADFAGRAAWSYSPHGDAVRRGDEPLVVSEFGNWGLPNVHQLYAASGGEPWWFATGEAWGSGATKGLVHPQGVLERFAALRLADAFGSYEGFIAASHEQQRQALAYEIAEMRRHPSIHGYVITELTDVHWECNGLLDLANNPKAFQRTFAQINADDAVVPEIRPAYRRSFWSGDEIVVGYTVSQYSGKDLRGAMVRWWVVELPLPPAPSPTGRGGASRAAVGASPPLPVGEGAGGRGSSGDLRFPAPSVSTPTAFRLHLELIGSAGEALARNELDLYVYPPALRGALHPRRLHLIGPDNRVVELAGILRELGYSLTAEWRQADASVSLGFSEASREIVRGGGRVLGLIEDVGNVAADLGSLAVIEREGTGYAGDWASSFAWVSPERLPHRVPSGPRLDWAFASVAPDQVLGGLKAEAIGREALAALFLGWLQKPVSLAIVREAADLEPNAGVLPEGQPSGRALLTTLRLAQPRGSRLGEDPAATILFHDFVDYLISR